MDLSLLRYIFFFDFWNIAIIYLQDTYGTISVCFFASQLELTETVQRKSQMQ